MLYRIVHFVNAWYALTILWVYILAFLAGFSFMFIFPQITILLLFLGLAGLAGAFIGAKLLGAMERTLRQNALANGLCPGCHHELMPTALLVQPRQCEHCGCEFPEL